MLIPNLLLFYVKVPLESARELRNRWGEVGIIIEQDLYEAVFGLTFVALDPDGHRIRVCMPDKQ